MFCLFRLIRSDPSGLMALCVFCLWQKQAASSTDVHAKDRTRVWCETVLILSNNKSHDGTKTFSFYGNSQQKDS